MAVVCELCGDVGVKHLLVQCNNCMDSTRHRYCMDTIIYDAPPIEWWCQDCLPKQNELMESLEAFSIPREQNHIQLDPSIINGSYADRVELTKELWSWGRRRYRSRMARRHASKHFLNGGTFNSLRMFIGKVLKHNDAEKEVENTIGHLIDSSKCIDGPNHSASNPTSNIEEHINVQKTGAFETTMKSLEELDLLKENDSYFPPIQFDKPIPQRPKADLFPSIDDVDRHHQCVTGNSCPILLSVEQANGFILSIVSAEQPDPLEVIKPSSDHSASDPALDSAENIGFENRTGSSELTIKSMEWLDLSKEKDSCISLSNYVVGSIPQVMKTDLFLSVNDVEQSNLSIIDGCSPAIPSEEQVDCTGSTLESWKQCHPLEVAPPLVNMTKDIKGAKSPSNFSHPVQGSDLSIGHGPLNPSKVFLYSRSMSKAIEPSCSSNGQGGLTVEKDGSDETKCMLDKECVAPALDNRKGSSLSNTKDCFVSNGDNRDEVNISDMHFWGNTDNKEQEQSMITSDISKGEILWSGLDERSSSVKINGSSDPKLMLMGNNQGSNLQDDLQKTSVHANQYGICKQVSETVSNRDNPDEVNISEIHILGNTDNREQTQLMVTSDQNILKGEVHCSGLDERSSSVKINENSDPKSMLMENNQGSNLQDDVPKTSVHADQDGIFKQVSQTDGINSEALPSETVSPCKETKSRSEKRQNRPNRPRKHLTENLKKRRMHVEIDVMNQTRSVEHCTGELPGTSNCHVNNYAPAKKQKLNDDGNALLGEQNGGCIQNDTAQLASQDVVAGDHCSVSRMPVISVPTDQHCDIPTQPIDEPYWTGIMKIDKEYISLAAHLSNKSCKEVQELSRSLPPVMKVTNHRKLKAWPNGWKESKPTAESIALYFFPDNKRPNEDLDRLVQYVSQHSVVLKYTMDLAKLLIFPSVFLPEKFQMFQGKHYLWGLFMHREAKSKVDSPVKIQDSKKRKDQQDKVEDDTLDQEKPVPPVKEKQNEVQVDTLDQEKTVPQLKKQDCTSEVVKRRKEKQDKLQVEALDQEKHVPLLKKQDCTSQVVKKRKERHDFSVLDDTLNQENLVPLVKKRDCKAQVVEKRKKKQDLVQADTLDQEKCVSKHNIPNDKQQSAGTVDGIDTHETRPSDDLKAQSSSDSAAPRILGFFHAQAPRSGHYIRQLKDAGAQLFCF